MSCRIRPYPIHEPEREDNTGNPNVRGTSRGGAGETRRLHGAQSGDTSAEGFDLFPKTSQRGYQGEQRVLQSQASSEGKVDKHKIREGGGGKTDEFKESQTETSRNETKRPKLSSGTGKKWKKRQTVCTLPS